ncbi:spore germination protein GerPE [Fictibacillus sp. Mic-4]|uniref:spore germination protein GerPE n=1 Tax=Fictibacillus TaxID=1329200 RepID=UPI0004157242|nr:spore germination protein GerPE [Fictibacillus gelatini]
MIKRTSAVDHMNIVNVTSTAVFEVGDSETINSTAWIMAFQSPEMNNQVQKIPDFAHYKIFSKPNPVLPEVKKVRKITFNEDPFIRVNSVTIVLVSTSATLHVGSTKSIHLQSRTINVRMLQGSPSDLVSDPSGEGNE